MQLLGERGARLGLSSPRQFFWVTGALSSFLDNTPTYVALSAAASSLHGTDPQVRCLRPPPAATCTDGRVMYLFHIERESVCCSFGFSAPHRRRHLCLMDPTHFRQLTSPSRIDVPYR